MSGDATDVRNTIHTRAAGWLCDSRVRRLILTAFLCLPLLLTGCNEEKRGPLLTGSYSAWERTTETELDYPIPGHEDNYRRIYINETGMNVRITTGEDGVRHYYPEGTVIIKEVFEGSDYQEGSEPVMLTAMVKQPSDPLARGGWLWVVKNLSTGRETVMETKFCVTCHANANEAHPYGDGNPQNEFRDFVFFPYSKALGQE